MCEEVFRPIRFFCITCHKEIWDLMIYGEKEKYTLEELLLCLTCSDCLLEDLRNAHKT